MPFPLRSIFGGLAALLCSAGMAAAYPATVTTSLNLRSGPGAGYGVLATMPPGAVVDVRNCLGNGWCRLAFAGAVGYASGNYLAGAPTSSAIGVAPLLPEYYAYAYQYPPYWSGGYYHYWYGGNWRRVRRSRSWWQHHRRAILAHRHRAEHRLPGRRAVPRQARQPHHMQRQPRRGVNQQHRSHNRAQQLRRRGAAQQRVHRPRPQHLRPRTPRPQVHRQRAPRTQNRAHRQRQQPHRAPRNR